ncbi:MAG: NAD(P)/FAD-dependent oxidoreductase, partial [Pseudomonadota bacterium]
MRPITAQACSSRVSADVIVIGAGHAGLATSYLLTEAGLSHVVLERGETANAWKTERWDSLRLLTPSWLTRLPGARYLDGANKDFMHVSELADFLDGYAEAFRLPVITGANVTSLRRRRGIFEAHTASEVWRAKVVVLASGAFNKPAVPKIAEQMPDSLMQLTPFDYRSPDSVATDGVLIVGASATGLQLADELVTAGRRVTLAVGEHVRMPRRYRGEDIFYWLHKSGIHDQRYDELDDLERGRSLPSPQLMGRRSPDLDLNSLQKRGV